MTYCEPYVSDLYYWSTGEDAYTTDITGEGTVQINISDVNFTDSEDEKYYNEHFKQDLQDAIDNKSEKLEAYVYIDSNDTLIDHFTVNPYYTNPGGTISLDGDILTVTFSSSHNNESYHDNGEFTEGWDDVDEAHFTLDFYLINETHYYVFSKFNGVNVVRV